jgi:uracil-DNA glycosylase
MQLNIENDWKELLQEEFDKDYFKKLTDFVSNQYTLNICYPPENEIFKAFNYCSFQDLKVVLIGQDPYHGKGQANGLCFSVNEGVKYPPSLRNIFKELEADSNKLYPKSGDLSHWAKQGVLMLNATLTVQEAKAGSHQKQGWEQFTDAVIKIISDKKQDVIFLLWGGFAIKKSKLIDKKKHYLLTSGHPSPLSANRGYWFGNKHFSKANALLKIWNKKEINW